MDIELSIHLPSPNLNTCILAPEDKLYPGLLIQAHRFVAVWPFNESAAKKFSVKWIVNGVEKKHEHFDGPTTSSELILSNKCVHISVDVVKTPIDGTEPINFKLEYDASECSFSGECAITLKSVKYQRLRRILLV